MTKGTHVTIKKFEIIFSVLHKLIFFFKIRVAVLFSLANKEAEKGVDVNAHKNCLQP
jgi:hypothetical protein